MASDATRLKNILIGGGVSTSRDEDEEDEEDPVVAPERWSLTPWSECPENDSPWPIPRAGFWVDVNSSVVGRGDPWFVCSKCTHSRATNEHSLFSSDRTWQGWNVTMRKCIPPDACRGNRGDDGKLISMNDVYHGR